MERGIILSSHNYENNYNQILFNLGYETKEHQPQGHSV